MKINKTSNNALEMNECHRTLFELAVF